MKEAGYRIFGIIFAICRIFPWKENKVLLFNGHNQGLNGNLLEMKKALEQEKKGYTFVYMAKRDALTGGFWGKMKTAGLFFVVLPYHMATAGMVFLNDNFLPLAYCAVPKKTKMVQLWHGAGAFKRFGLSTERNPKVVSTVKRANGRVTHLFVTAKGIIPFYRQAFGIERDKIYATGLPVTDVYYDEKIKKEAYERFYKTYPQIKGKKLFLYTPTFRNTKEENDNILPMLGIEKMHTILGDAWVIGIRMHPKYPVRNMPQADYIVDLTTYPQMTDLYFASDMLMTDYSSTVVEYCLLDKPMLFYAYDLEQYDRGFYFDYREKVPGMIAGTQEELYALLENSHDMGKKRRQDFVKMQHDYQDTESAQRIIRILEKEKIQGRAE